MSDNKDNDSPKPEDQTSAADEWADALEEQGTSDDQDVNADDALAGQTAGEGSDEDDIWGDAMAEQGASESGDDDVWGDALAEQESSEGGDEPWGDALAEQSQSTPGGAAQGSTQAESGGDKIFKPLGDDSGGKSPRDLDMIMEIPVTLSVELGQTRLTIHELLDLSQGSIIELDGLAGEPMDIQINGYLIAQGEVVVVDDRYGIRITDIITPSERIHKLNR